LNQQKLLILDLDETLIHGAKEKLDYEPACVAPWCFLYKRPYVEEFMDFCKEHFKVAIWTTASPEHAEMALGQICEADYPFEFIWTANRCTQVRDKVGMYDFGIGYHWVKDLKKIKRRGFKLEQTIMVDDTPSMLERQYGNLVPIKRFKGEPDDHELIRLIEYLKRLINEPNIRKVEKRFWRESTYCTSGINL